MFKGLSIIIVFLFISLFAIEGFVLHLDDFEDRGHLHDKTRFLFSKVRQVLYVDNEQPINVPEVIYDLPLISHEDDTFTSFNEASNHSTRAPPANTII